MNINMLTLRQLLIILMAVTSSLHGNLSTLYHKQAFIIILLLFFVSFSKLNTHCKPLGAYCSIFYMYKIHRTIDKIVLVLKLLFIFDFQWCHHRAQTKMPLEQLDGPSTNQSISGAIGWTYNQSEQQDKTHPVSHICLLKCLIFIWLNECQTKNYFNMWLMGMIFDSCLVCSNRCHSIKHTSHLSAVIQRFGCWLRLFLCSPG